MAKLRTVAEPGIASLFFLRCFFQYQHLCAGTMGGHRGRLGRIAEADDDDIKAFRFHEISSCVVQYSL
jgi:hypothetical protein